MYNNFQTTLTPERLNPESESSYGCLTKGIQPQTKYETT